MTDAVLEQRLFANGGVPSGARYRAEPDWAAAARELKRPGVTLMILWEEYRAVHPEGYVYSRYCQLFRAFEQRLSPSMRQNHVAGDKGVVDYSGKRVPIIDPLTGVVHEAGIFASVLGASNFTCAEATWTQGLPDWIGAHVRSFRFWDAVPRLLVPDNLKSGVQKASFYDPEINRSYGAMAAHYGVGILPARPYRPKDKARVEVGVRIAQSYILVLHPGPVAPSDLLLAGRMQCGDPPGPGATQRPAGAPPRAQPAATVRHRRAAGDAAAARDRPRIRRMAARQGRPRLPRRGRRVLLFRPARPDPRAGRDAADRAHGGGVPSRPARRRTSAPLRRPAARHRARSYAERAPALCRVEPRAVPTPGSRHRPQYRSARVRGAGAATASGTGVPHLPRHPASVSRYRRHPRRSGLPRAIEIGALTYKSVASILAHRLDSRTAPRAAGSAPILHANIRGSRSYH